jgi:pimeloyl-ACP methyl ester carboxylesterase
MKTACVAQMPRDQKHKRIGHIGMFVPSRKSIDLPLGSVSFLEWKSRESAPLIIFAHANGFNANTYRALLLPLAEHFNIAAFDMRGHGQTNLPTDERLISGWRVYRDDLLKVVEHFRDSRVVLAGHSLGASASLMAAAANPSNVRGVVLIEPVLPPFKLALRAVVARALGREETMLPRVGPARRRRRQFESREQAVTGFRGRGAFKSWPEEMLADYIEGGTEPFEGGYRLSCAPEWEAANFAVFPFGLASLAGRVRMPLAVLYAEHHSSAPESELETVRTANRNARIVRVPGTTHFLPMERPDLVGAEIAAMAERAGALGTPAAQSA